MWLGQFKCEYLPLCSESTFFFFSKNLGSWQNEDRAFCWHCSKDCRKFSVRRFLSPFMYKHQKILCVCVLCKMFNPFLYYLHGNLLVLLNVSSRFWFICASPHKRHVNLFFCLSGSSVLVNSSKSFSDFSRLIKGCCTFTTRMAERILPDTHITFF